MLSDSPTNCVKQTFLVKNIFSEYNTLYLSSLISIVL